MGQSHNFFSCCGYVPSKKECLNPDHIYSPSAYSQERRESGNDSGNSSAESLSPNREPRMQRCSQSSESSGKFSFRGSISSPAEEAQNKNCRNNAAAAAVATSDDLPVFCEGNETEELTPNHEPLVHKKRRSLSAVGHLGTKFFRSKSASISSRPWSRTVEEEEEEPMESRPRRAVSLRLPRSQQPNDIDTKVPTVYVDDNEGGAPSTRARRRSSIREALSLLSLNSLTKELSSSSSGSRSQKPVQKILRHPTRRHTTVRGISGLAIDGRSQIPSRGGNGRIQRAQTLVYYPTSTSMRTNYILQGGQI